MQIKNIFKIDKISLYITKNIIKNFLIIFFGLFILFFAVDFFEVSKDVKQVKDGLKIATQVSLFRIPNLIETILHFIVLLAGLFTFYKLSNNSEIVVIRSSGKSIFQIVKFSAFVAFLIGIFVITLYNPMASVLNAKSIKIKNVYIKHEKEDLFESQNGIWLKQKNLENDGNIIIKSSRVYRDLLIFNDVILIFTDSNNNFEKRIDSDMIKLSNNKWILTNNYITQKGLKSEFLKEMELPTNLSKSFISKTIQNNYDSIYNIPFWKLKSSIKAMNESGFDSRKFEIRYYYLLTLPFLYAIMILISAYFGIVHNRENKKYLSIVYGIAVGFAIFITHNIVFELTSANKFTIFDGSVIIVSIYIILTIYLLMKKDTLSNFK